MSSKIYSNYFWSTCHSFSWFFYAILDFTGAYSPNFSSMSRVSNRGVVANVLGCNIVVREFELQTLYNIRFWINILGKDKNIPHSYVLVLFFYTEGFGIK